MCMYIYICVCVCVCACVLRRGKVSLKYHEKTPISIFIFKFFPSNGHRFKYCIIFFKYYIIFFNVLFMKLGNISVHSHL